MKTLNVFALPSLLAACLLAGCSQSEAPASGGAMKNDSAMKDDAKKADGMMKDDGKMMKEDGK